MIISIIIKPRYRPTTDSETDLFTVQMNASINYVRIFPLSSVSPPPQELDIWKTGSAVPKSFPVIIMFWQSWQYTLMISTNLLLVYAVLLGYLVFCRKLYRDRLFDIYWFCHHYQQQKAESVHQGSATSTSQAASDPSPRSASVCDSVTTINDVKSNEFI